jgi:DNA polymerase zeta
VDHYQAIPTSYDPQLRRDVRASQMQNEPKVPVIRVFGSTETGQKVCAHIHGAFPYLYIEYTGSLVPDESELSTSYSCLSKLTCDLSWGVYSPASSFN